VFGASQIVSFANQAQGPVSAFLAVEMTEITNNIELASTGYFTLQELLVRTNLATYEEFPEVDGTVVSAYDPLQVSFQFQLPSDGRVSSVDNIVTGMGVTMDGETCMFTSFESFPILFV
jgi:hypothetical protein